ncbi:hypothetical protein WA026_019426 [Henosepilachna vigintioctopunctata]|uniref:PHD-type domain-containing protein n=1 Tax=Henosepilachna vigintioctopunctata TaxID=420089 RepID=A0AAW1UAL2_9CUCU
MKKEVRKTLGSDSEKPEEVRAKVRKGSQKKVQNPIHALSEFQSSTESKSIRKSEYSIKCFGTCDRWFHRNCSHLTNQKFSEYEKGLTKKKWRCRSCADRDQDEETEDESMKLKFVKGSSNDEPNLGAVMVLLKQMNTKFEKFEESLIFNGDLLSE